MGTEMEVTGTVRGTRGGFAFLIREDGGEDLLIAKDGLHGAIHGDRVRVSLFSRPRDFRPLAVVDEILERPQPYSTGELVRAGRSFYLRPDSPMLPEQIPARLGSQPPTVGAKVRFRVENSDKKNRALLGVVEEILGDAEDARLDTVVLATEFGLNLRFPDAAVEEAERFVHEDELPEDARREDFRAQFVVTIDPEDAKDFDDAVSVTRTADDGYILTVHIADVTAYVPEGGPLDTEAFARGTSTYFPGAVVPMLPESISTVAASLTPGTDKRTMTVVLEFDRGGRLRGRRLTRGLIRSAARLTYEQAQEVFEGKASVDRELDSHLGLMLGLARRLRELRFEHGGFEIDVPEARILLGSDGVPVRIGRRTHLEAHELIEEFMIAANRAVGGWAREHEVPFSFRIHLPPEARAMEDFASVATMLIPSTPADVFDDPRRFRSWLAGLREDRLGSIVHRFFLRAMQKAVYCATDRGHFGLGIDGYAHFTSPIRRYSDLFNHRRIKERLDAEGSAGSGSIGPTGATGLTRSPRPIRPTKSSEPSEPPNSTELPELTKRRGLSDSPELPEPRIFSRGELETLARTVSEQCSRREQIAEQAEREMIRLKSARYLATRLGEILPGRVTALTHRGLFVELKLGPVEGFVPRDSFAGRMNFDEKRLAWVGDRGGWEFRPGDPVRVQIVQVDLRRRQIEFAIESSPKRRQGGSPRRGRAPAGTAKKGRRLSKGRGSSGRNPSGGRRGRGRAESRAGASGVSSAGSGRRKKSGASGRPRKKR